MTKTTNNKFTALKSYNLDIEGTASSAAEQRRLAELDASTTAEHGQLSSTMLNLYGFWQTEKYVLPYIGKKSREAERSRVFTEMKIRPFH